MPAEDGWRALAPGAALTLWARAAPEVRHYPGRARPMPDRVDYRFRNGWTDTGDLPCREALRKALADREIARPEGPYAEVCFALDGLDLDFSTFCYRPTLIAHPLSCRVRTEAAGRAVVEVATCGGVRLWLDEEPIADFEPFTRNRRQTTRFFLDLPVGEHALTLRLEDLHERDTVCVARLTWLEGPAAATALPRSLAVDPDELAATARSLRIDRIFHERGAIRIAADPPPPRLVRLSVAPPTTFPRGGLSSDPHQPPRRALAITPEEPYVSLAESAAAPAGCLGVDVELEVGPARLRRQLGTTNLPPGIPLLGEFAARRAQAADAIAAARGFEPSVAALLACRGEAPERVAAIVAAALDTVEAREDCSDFTVLPLLRLWRDARDRLAAPLRERLRTALLGWRYWLDEPGNDVMWFWSENHVLCFHAAQRVAGSLFPEETFANSGKSGAQLGEEAKKRLHRWFDAVERDGLCEWNSAAYYPIDLLGLLTLHDMAPDLRERAGRAMDRIFAMTALHTTGGVPAGAQGRCYEKELLAGPATELGSVAAVAFGGEFRPGYDRAAALLCLSDYAPPVRAAALARPGPDDRIEARYVQGADRTGQLTLWKTAHAQLSTSCGHTAGVEGHQSQVLDVQFAAHPMARLWINHPGELWPWGARRPSLLAGNHVMPRVAQAGPTALMIYDLDRPWTDLDVTQLFAAPDAFDRVEQVAGWRILAAGAGMAGVWCSRPLQEVGGLYRGAIGRAHGLRTAWVVALSLPGEDRSAFLRRVVASEPRFDETALYLDVGGDAGARLSLTHDGPFRVAGERLEFGPLTTEPHVSLNGGRMEPWTEPLP